MNPYQPTTDPRLGRGPDAQARPSLPLGVIACSQACRLLSGVDFLLLPIASVGVILQIEEGLRQGYAQFSTPLVTVVVPVCLTIGGLSAARASLRWQRGEMFTAILESAFATIITLLPWCLAYAS